VVETDEFPLPGGTAHRDQVTRRGGTVRRPSGPYTPAVHALLDHLAERGFTGAPRALGAQGDTEILTYLDGEAAYLPGRPGTIPLPAWALTDAAMVSVARLLRRFHDASETFDPSGLPWQRPVPEGWAGPRVTHNDTHPANVIFRDGQATGLIDFDLAGPGTVGFELAVAACFWVPIRAESDIGDERGSRLWERLRLFLDGYGATDETRSEVVRGLAVATEWIFGIIREAAERGHPAFVQMWAERADMAERAAVFVETHQDELRAAAC
jgi:Ser/Thr protein kinase RdoA (MazF antagonist)